MTDEKTPDIQPGLMALVETLNEMAKEREHEAFAKLLFKRATDKQIACGGPDIYNWQLTAHQMAGFYNTYQSVVAGVGWDVVLQWINALQTGGLLAHRMTPEEKAAAKAKAEEDARPKLVVPDQRIKRVH